MAYYTEYGTGTQNEVTADITTKWFNKPVTAKIVCNNAATLPDVESSTDACMCALQVRSTNTMPISFDTSWVAQNPVNDLTTYVKTFPTSDTV